MTGRSSFLSLKKSDKFAGKKSLSHQFIHSSFSFSLLFFFFSFPIRSRSNLSWSKKEEEEDEEVEERFFLEEIHKKRERKFRIFLSFPVAFSISNFFRCSSRNSKEEDAGI